MFLAHRPSTRELQKFTEDSRALPLSYSQIGMAQDEPRSFDIDETTEPIGRGDADFERAKAALAGWKHFEFDWVEVFPRNAPIESGTVVVVLIRHLGLWSLNGCRVVYGIGDRERGTRFGFAYGTLVNHAESGEEIFEVLQRPESADVVYRIRAVSKPRAVLARLGYPIVRRLQARFRRDSASAMRRAIAGL